MKFVFIYIYIYINKYKNLHVKIIQHEVHVVSLKKLNLQQSELRIVFIICIVENTSIITPHNVGFNVTNYLHNVTFRR